MNILIEEYYKRIKKTKIIGFITLIIFAIISLITIFLNFFIGMLFILIFIILREIWEIKINYLENKIEKQTKINIEKIANNTKK